MTDSLFRSLTRNIYRVEKRTLHCRPCPYMDDNTLYALMFFIASKTGNQQGSSKQKETSRIIDEGELYSTKILKEYCAYSFIAH